MYDSKSKFVSIADLIAHRLKNEKLVYKVFSFLVDLDELANLSTKFILFSYNAPSLFSIYDRDPL